MNCRLDHSPSPVIDDNRPEVALDIDPETANFYGNSGVSEHMLVNLGN